MQLEDSDEEDEDEDSRRLSLGRPPSIYEMPELPTKEGYLMMRGTRGCPVYALLTLVSHDVTNDFLSCLLLHVMQYSDYNPLGL